MKKQSPGSRVTEQALTCLIDQKNLNMYEKLGNGSFGVVRRGDWMTPAGSKVNLKIWKNIISPVFFSQIRITILLLQNLKVQLLVTDGRETTLSMGCVMVFRYMI